MFEFLNLFSKFKLKRIEDEDWRVCIRYEVFRHKLEEEEDTVSEYNLYDKLYHMYQKENNCDCDYFVKCENHILLSKDKNRILDRLDFLKEIQQDDKNIKTNLPYFSNESTFLIKDTDDIVNVLNEIETDYEIETLTRVANNFTKENINKLFGVSQETIIELSRLRDIWGESVFDLVYEIGTEEQQRAVFYLLDTWRECASTVKYF